MNHPEGLNEQLNFNVADPYECYVYECLLDLLLEAVEDDPGLPARIREQGERNKNLIGPRRAALVYAQAALDEADIRYPRTELLGWHS